jgi:hypothetical protein
MIYLTQCCWGSESTDTTCWDHNLVLCELRNSTNNLINHQDINHTQEYKCLQGKPFLLEGKKPRDKLQINPLL